MKKLILNLTLLSLLLSMSIAINGLGLEADISDDQLTLIDAVLENKSELVQKIVSGCDYKTINKRDKYGMTALHWAVANNKIELAKILLSHKDISIMLLDDKGFSPLGLALRYKNLELAKLLLVNGANPNVGVLLWNFDKADEADMQVKSLQQNAKSSLVAIFNLITKLITFSNTDEDTKTDLENKIIRTVVRENGEEDFYPSMITDEDETLLSVAKEYGYENLAKVLLALEAKDLSKNCYRLEDFGNIGDSAAKIHIDELYHESASKSDDVAIDKDSILSQTMEMIRQLEGNNQSEDESNMKLFVGHINDRFIQMASYRFMYNANRLYLPAKCELEKIKKLLADKAKNGLDINHRDAQYQCTALQLAAINGDVLLTQLLLANKADPNLVSNNVEQRTAREYALRYNHPNIVTLIDQYCLANNI